MPLSHRLSPRKPQRPRQRIVQIDERRVVTQGLERRFWADFYHHCVTVPWPVFFLGYAVYFLTMNGVFALLYNLGANPIAHAEGSFLRLFFFSVETLATVGYGDMHPQTLYADVISTIETFLGLSSLAIVTGLIFQRFSQPRARILFADVLALAPHEGRPTLMLRIANERHKMITEASAELWMTYLTQTQEGMRYRRFVPLKMERDKNPLFALSWTIFHIIDEASPLHNKTPDDLSELDANIVLTLKGFEETSHQSVHSRRNYTHKDIRWDEHYVDILEVFDSSLIKIDYTRFHLTEKRALS